MTANWLQIYLIDAVNKNLCTKVYCTTCGALDFRKGVLLALARKKDERPLQKFNRESVIEIARALAEVTPDICPTISLEDAVKCLIIDLWSGLPFLDKEVEDLLAGTWSGNILQDMKSHHEARESTRREKEAYEYPVNVQKRREEKKRLKQEQHQERLLLKKERDKLWLKKHGK